jgi:hypothetical protein
MSFMKLVCEHTSMYTVETTDGSELVPVEALGKEPSLEDFGPYCESDPLEFDIVEGFFAHYTAPGYLDQTPWIGPYQTEEEAIRECKGFYGDDENNEDE